MKKKYIGILVIGLAILFFGAAVTPTLGSQSVKLNINTRDIAPMDRSWSDDFSAYTLGQFLDGDPTDGGWKGWDNDPGWGAFVVDTQEHSVPHSVEVLDYVDLVREFSGYTTGTWTFTAWQYVPGNFVGLSYFILLSDYADGAGQDNIWAVQLRFDSDLQIVESEFDDVNLSLITDRWVELRFEIDLNTDWLEMYYDGVLLHAKAWTAGPNNQGDGQLKIAAVDLYANTASVIYYDDMSLSGDTPIPAICCDGALSWTTQVGSTVTGSFEVSNCGDVGSSLDWEVKSWPTWGTGWTFTPASGTGLTPAGSPVTVQVQVTVPSEELENFGEISIINSNEPSEKCEIDVYCKTPKNKVLFNTFLPRLFERFPNAFPILQQVLGL
jgi:hypothetical protein